MASIRDVFTNLRKAKDWALDQASGLRGGGGTVTPEGVAQAQQAAPKGYEMAGERVPNKPHYKPTSSSVAPKPGNPHFNRGAGQGPAAEYLKSRADVIQTAPKGAERAIGVAGKVGKGLLRTAGPIVTGLDTAREASRLAQDPSNVGQQANTVDAATRAASTGIAPVLGPLVTTGVQMARDALLPPALRAAGVMPPEYNPNVITPNMAADLKAQEARAAQPNMGTKPTMLDPNTRIRGPVQPPAATTAVTTDGRPPMGAPVIPGQTSLGELADRPGVGAVTGPNGKTVQLRTAPVAGPTGPNPNAYAPHQGGTGPRSAGSRGFGDIPGGIMGLAAAGGLARAAVADDVRNTNVALRTRGQDILLDRTNREDSRAAATNALKSRELDINAQKYNFEAGVQRGERNWKILDSSADAVADTGKDGQPLPQERDAFRTSVAETLSRRGKEVKDLDQAQIQNLTQAWQVKKLIGRGGFFGDNFTSDDLTDYAPVARKGSKYLFPMGQEVEAEDLIGGTKRWLKPNDQTRKDVQRWLDQSVKEAEASRKSK